MWRRPSPGARKRRRARSPRRRQRVDQVSLLAVGCALALLGLSALILAADRTIGQVRLRNASATITATVDGTRARKEKANDVYSVRYHFSPPGHPGRYGVSHLLPWPHGNSWATVDFGDYLTARSDKTVLVRYDPRHPDVNTPVDARAPLIPTVVLLLPGLLFSWIGFALVSGPTRPKPEEAEQGLSVLAPLAPLARTRHRHRDLHQQRQRRRRR